ncbi:regulator of chromosome condensation [Escherichia phage UB]|nr:hypothetical protein [Escherichia coli]AXC36545.1 regulator of chromosome condensation [Escherichia phage UB]
MLPFARMVKYGNKVIPYVPNFTKLVTPAVGYSFTCTMLLDVNGSVWAMGLQNGGIFGLGNTTQVTEWTKIYSNVKDFWCSTGNGFCLIRTNDDRFFYSGLDKWLGNNTTNTVTTFTECTSYFTQFGISKIKEIYVGLDYALILGTDNSLYLLGDNKNSKFGLNTASYFNKFTFLVDNVKKFCSSITPSNWIIKLDNTIWRTGTTSHGTLGNGVQNTYIFPWVQYKGTPVTEAIDVFCSASYIGIITKGTPESCPMYTMGYQADGQLGNNTTAGGYKLTPTLSKTVPDDSEFIRIENISSRGLVYYSSGKIYSTGYNNNGQLANNSTINSGSFVEAILPDGVNFKKSESLVAGNDATLYMYINNKLYYAGKSPDNISASSSSVMKEFPLPTINAST